MLFQYREWDPLEISRQERFKLLVKLLNLLLLQTNGDLEEALQWLDQFGRKHGLLDEDYTLEDFKKDLERQGNTSTDARTGRTRLTSRGVRGIRRSALEQIFQGLRMDAIGGNHRTNHPGQGQDRLTETRPYRFGDALGQIAATPTLSNAIRRAGIEEFNLIEEDLEVYENEQNTSCATVLLLDVSHSMILYGEDRITPAKQAAMALVELIQTRYPKDDLRVVLFGDDAVEVPIRELHKAGVGPFHTNTLAGLQLARRILTARKHRNKQVFMVTDGKPSCMWDQGRLYKNASWTLDRRIVTAVLNEASQLRRKRIPITTFMVTEDPTLVRFVEELTEINKGRAFYTSPTQLGSFLMVDYMSRRRLKRGG